MSDFSAISSKQVEKDLNTVALYPVLLPLGTLLTSGLMNAGIQLCGTTASDDATLVFTMAAGVTSALIRAVKTHRATNRLIAFSLSDIEGRAQALEKEAKEHDNYKALAELELIQLVIDHKKDQTAGNSTKFFAKTLGLAAFQSLSVYLGGAFLPDLFTNGIEWKSVGDQMKLFLSIAPTPLCMIFAHAEAADLRDKVQANLPPIQVSRDNDNQSTTGTPRYAKSAQQPAIAAPRKLINGNSPENR